MSRVMQSGAAFRLLPPPRARRLGLTIAAVTLGALCVVSRPGSAQSANEQSAYVALIYTPVSGLPPLPPVDDSSGRRNGMSMIGRLGHTSRGGGSLTLTSYALGVEVPRGRMRLGATIGYLSASCGFEWQGDDDCAGDIMIGGSVRSWLTTRTLGNSEPPQRGRKGAPAKNEGKLVVGFDGNVGYSPRQGEGALAVAASLPTALALQSGTVRITPFLTPGIAYGRLGTVAFEEDEVPTSHGSIVPTIGGGVGLQFGTSGIGANVGFQRVLKGAGGATQLGIGMTWQGLTAAR